MKAAVLRTLGALQIEDLSIESPGPQEVLVRTAHAGLCHSDLHFIDGVFPAPRPIVMGHEAAGIVEAVGERVTYVAPGDHVVTCLSSFCGECSSCLRGRPNLCTSRTRLQRPTPHITDSDGAPVAAIVGLGSFAEQMLVNERSVAKISPDTPLAVASLVGCGVLTGVGAVLRTAHVEPGSSVAVIGCGGIGLAAIQGAVLAGATPIVAVDVAEGKLEHAKAVGATHVVDGSAEGVVDVIRDISSGGVDYSFEAVGLKQTCEQSFAMLRPGGVATIIGMVPIGTNLEIPALELYTQEKRLQGSNMGSNRFRVDIPWLCDLHLDGRLALDELVSAHRPLEEINDGYEDMRRGQGLRTVIDFAL